KTIGIKFSGYPCGGSFGTLIVYVSTQVDHLHKKIIDAKYLQISVQKWHPIREKCVGIFSTLFDQNFTTIRMRPKPKCLNSDMNWFFLPFVSGSSTDATFNKAD